MMYCCVRWNLNSARCPMSFGEQMWHLREVAGLTQPELVGRAGITVGALEPALGQLPAFLTPLVGREAEVGRRARSASASRCALAHADRSRWRRQDAPCHADCDGGVRRFS